jgi:hypothetical protein
MEIFDNTIERRVEDRRMSSGEKILRTQLYQAQSKICELEDEIKQLKSVPPRADAQPVKWFDSKFGICCTNEMKAKLTEGFDIPIYGHVGPSQATPLSHVELKRQAALLLSLRTNADPKLFSHGQLDELNSCLSASAENKDK